jgi:hypothetical protein
VTGNWDFNVLQVWRGLTSVDTATANVKQALQDLKDGDAEYLDALPYQRYFPGARVCVGVRLAHPRTLLQNWVFWLCMLVCVALITRVHSFLLSDNNRSM